jgi:hypothetical protein
MSTANTPTLELRNLEVSYTVRGIDRQVLRDVSLSIAPGEAYGLVGDVYHLGAFIKPIIIASPITTPHTTKKRSVST